MLTRYICPTIRGLLFALLPFWALLQSSPAWASPNAGPPAQTAACNPATDVGGIVFRDYNADGVQDTNEPGLDRKVAPVTVTAYGAANQLLGSATIQADGSYTISSPNWGRGARIEFSGLPTWLQPSAHSGSSSTLVQFVGGPNCNVKLAVNNPRDFCGANPQLATTCFTSGDPLGGDSAGNSDALVTWSYAESGWWYPYPSIAVAGTAAMPTKLALSAQMGSTWGIAYQRSTKTIFTSAVLKRHAGFGPFGPGGIYAVDISDPNVPVVRQFLDLTALVGGDPRTTPLPVKADAQSRDPEALPWIGKMSFGGMDISEDERTLYVMNLNNNGALIVLDIESQSVTAQVPISAPNPGCQQTTGAISVPAPKEDIRPWAVKVKDGEVYVGVVCSAQTSQNPADLHAYVMQLEGNTFTTVFDFKLDYKKGIVSDGKPKSKTDTGWFPWTDDFNMLISLDPGEKEQTLIHPQPILSAIEFDADGSMILGFSDRTGHMGGRKNLNPNPNDATLYNAHTGGDILRVCKKNGAYVLQGSPGCPNNAPNNQGPGAGEYYPHDDFDPGLPGGLVHQETSLGALALLPGAGEVVSTHFDAVRHVADGQDEKEPRTGGVRFHNNASGALSHSYEVYPDTDNLTGTFAKASGLGDLELLCDAAPIEIGNYVWRDSNGDGIQGPNESPLAGVTVELLDNSGQILASAVTDAAGQYYFSSAAGPSSTSARYSITALTPNTTGYQLRIPLNTLPQTTLRLTLSNAGGVENNDNKLDLNDSDGSEQGEFAAITFNTGGAGQNNHALDFGFTDLVLPVDIETLTNGAQADNPDDPDVPQIDPGDVVTWTFRVTNMGGAPIARQWLNVTDNVRGALLKQGVVQPGILFANQGDAVLEPAEVWTLSLTQPAPDLSEPGQTVGLSLVDGCTATGVRPTYRRVATVTAPGASDTDASYFCNPPRPRIHIEKAVNGMDADLAPGPPFTVGTPLTWTYVITNEGTVALTDLIVTDDKIDAAQIRCPANLNSLAPGDSLTCLANGEAKEGLYQNRGTVTATIQSAAGGFISDSDFSHYIGIIVTQPVFDWGDAPDTYRTTQQANGPSHRIVPDLYIGSGVDGEADGRPGPLADGDDLAQTDDEDGIENGACFVPGQPLNLNIPVTNKLGKGAQLYGWVDFDGNRTFDDSERRVANIASSSDDQMAALNFGQTPIPPPTFMRLRLSTDAKAVQPFGPADDGEVEDHALRFVMPTITADATELVRNVGQEAIINTAVTDICDSVEALSICYDNISDASAAECNLLPADGRFTPPPFKRLAPGTDQIVFWLDLDNNQSLSAAEPQVAVKVVWQKPGIRVETHINGERSPSPPGLTLREGAPITWTHTVSNSGDVTITNIVLTDTEMNQPIACPQNSLNPQSSMECQVVDVALAGEHSKKVEVLGHISATEIVTNSDTSYYIGIPAPPPPSALDWGDAPACYQTLAADNGPRHAIVPGLFIGAVGGDAESDGQASPAADGDDVNGDDDEDGVALNGCFVRGKPAVLNVTATNQLGRAAWLRGWVDFDNDCRFVDGVTATAYVTATSGAQTYALNFAQPLLPDASAVFMRLRLSSDTDPLAAFPVGPATDGEVEDHRIMIVTPSLSLAPSQVAAPLGDKVQLAATAAIPQSCDDASGLMICWEGGPDVDGCTSVGADGLAPIAQTCTVSGTFNVHAWIDLDGNGRRDAGEPAAASTVSCGDVTPPTHRITLAPSTAAPLIGVQHVLTATVVDVQGAPAAGQEVLFAVSGPNGPLTATRQTDGNGRAIFAYTGLRAGRDQVTATRALGGAAPAGAEVNWSAPYMITLNPITATVPISTQHTLTATVTDLQNARFEGGLAISVTVSGANGSLLATRQTDINGRAIFTYTGLHAGLDQVTATLAFGGAAPAVAKVNWLPITIVTPTLQITRIVGTDGILNPKVVDLQGRPVDGQVLHFEVSGVNRGARGQTKPTDSNGQTELRYKYISDQNELSTDWITATVRGANSSILATQTFSITWVPVSMLVQVITNTSEITPPIQISVQSATPARASLTVTDPLTVTILQENLEVITGSPTSTATLTFTVAQSAPGGQDAKPFRPKDKFAPLTPPNRSNPGCNIKAANGASHWRSVIWLDLNQDGEASGQEPTCVVEASTADVTPRFNGWSTADEVVLAWSTGVEIDLLGFNLYRASDPAGPYTLLNPHLIVAVGDALGADYRYVDQPPTAGLYFYQIESLSNSGRAVSEPIAVLFPAPEHSIYLPVAQH